MSCVLHLVVAGVGACTLAQAQAVHWRWPGSLGEVRSGEGQAAPDVVDFGAGKGLRFVRERATWCVAMDEDLRVTGALSIAVVVQFRGPVAAKAPFVSKWHTENGWRSYEMGILPGQRVYLDISGSGNWDGSAREVVSDRSLAADAPYLVVGVYEPGKRMALYVNGHPLGEVTAGVPEVIFDSETPVYIGNRYRAEQACAFGGTIGEVWVFDEALSEQQVVALARDVGLMEEPGPGYVFEPPFDLDAVREAAREWYAGLQAPGAQYGAYRLSPTHEPDMYASADIAWCRYMMDDLDLSEQERAEWTDFIQDQQNPDGTYRHLTGHCATHAFCHATGALGMLGGKHRYRPTFLREYARTERVAEWLERINWANQWGASHDIWGAGVPLMCPPQTPDEWREAAFAWLDREADRATGFWRKGVQARSPMEYVGGAFHIWPLYAAVERPIPYPERVIDSVLRLQDADGSFGGLNYGTMDAVWVLAYLTARTAYRRDEIREALRRTLEACAETYALAPEEFLSGAHSTESRIATLAILQTAAPEWFTSTTPWRDPWYERRLFEVEY